MRTMDFPIEERWVGGGDTGTSSLTIWAVLMNRISPHGRLDIPYDPDDLGRCYRLLRIKPEWEARLAEVAEAVPRWRPFVREWDKLIALFEDDVQNAPKNKWGAPICKKTYDFMQTLRDEADAISESSVVRLKL